jgi:LysM repeat protein
VPRHIRRRELTRIGAPLAFLLAVTILVLLVHSALSSGRDATGTTREQTRRSHTTTRQVTTPPTTTRRSRPPSGPAKRYYTIVAGDTFGTVAAKEGTTVAKLMALNPNVSSNALTIGQRIRVR